MGMEGKGGMAASSLQASSPSPAPLSRADMGESQMGLRLEA